MPALTESQMQQLLFHASSGAIEEVDESEITHKNWIVSPENVRAESICGIDQRQKVVATSQLPNIAICKLYMRAPNGRTYVGSGWLVANDRLYTAGHCVYSESAGGWMESIIVIPAKSGLSEPYGRYHAMGLSATRGWVEDGSVRYDMGAIKLDKPVTHNSFITPCLDDPSAGEVCGYPADRDSGIFQYRMSDTLLKQSGRFLYQADTFGGQSGCPLLKNRSHGIGIHNYGGCPNSSSDLYQGFIDGIINW